MSGLEVSEILLSELEFSNRIDSEYYRKIFLKWEAIIENHQHCNLSDVANFLIGPFGSSYNTDNYVDEPDYRYVRGQDVKPFLLMDTEPRYMDKNDFERLSRYALKANDILVSVVGTLGNACIVRKTDIPAIFSCKSTVIRVNDINAYYLIAYLNSKHGRELLLRKERGAIQKGLNLDDLRLLTVPLFSDIFEKYIEGLIVSANNVLDKSKSTYNSAESLLLSSLGMTSFTPSNEPVAVKSLSESFGVSGRLDAEYYQEKYEDYENKLNTSHSISVLCTIHDSAFLPQEGDYKYIELSDIGSSGNITGCTVAPFDELPSRARRLVKSRQVIVSSIEGSLSSCALITDDYDGAICSTGFYVVDSTVINSETLLILFKSEPIQALMKKRCSGTILTAISKCALETMPFPLIDRSIQQQISDLVQHSFDLRRQSEQLLETAKRAVEIAIEVGEDKSLKLLGVKEVCFT
jgi:restriction endonuclease S subunit